MTHYRFLLFSQSVLNGATELSCETDADAHAAGLQFLLREPSCDHVEIWNGEGRIEALQRRPTAAPEITLAPIA